MTGLEIIGAAAVYIVGFIVLGYVLIAVMAYFNRRGGLEVIPLIIGPSIVIWIVAAIVGLVLLGKML